MTLTRLFRLAGVTGVFLIVVLSLVPGSYRPHTGAPGGLEHFFAYTPQLRLRWHLDGAHALKPCSSSSGCSFLLVDSNWRNFLCRVGTPIW